MMYLAALLLSSSVVSLTATFGILFGIVEVSSLTATFL